VRFSEHSMLLVSILILSLIGCGTGIDERDRVRNTYGDPERKEQVGGGALSFETWYYDNYYQENVGLGFNFRKGAPKCGGDRDYYIYSQFGYRVEDSHVIITWENVNYYKAAPTLNRSPVGP